MLNRYSISHLALPIQVSDEIIDYLTIRGITGIELLPARLTNNWNECGANKIHEFSDLLKRKKIVIPAFQGIFYNTNILSLLNKNEQKLIVNHIQKVCELAKIFNVTNLIVGAPNLRKITKKNNIQDQKYPISLFKILADICENNGVQICLEAIGGDSNQNFISNHYDLCEFITLVNRKGMGLHVDSSVLIEKKEDIEKIINHGIDISHFHISENKLTPYKYSAKSQIEIIKKIKEKKVNCWLSFEYLLESNEQHISFPDQFIRDAINS